MFVEFIIYHFDTLEIFFEIRLQLSSRKKKKISENPSIEFIH